MPFKFFTVVAIGLITCSEAFAGSQSMAVAVSFDEPLTITKTADVSFGSLKANTKGVYVLDTNGVIAPSNGGVVVGGTATYGKITISGSASQTVSIRTGSYVANAGVIPSAATCVYNGAAIANCDAGASGLAAPGADGKVLKLGLRIDVDGSQTAGSAAEPTFVVAIIYG